MPQNIDTGGMGLGNPTAPAAAASAAPPNYAQAYQQLQGLYGQQYADLFNQYQTAQSQGMAQLQGAGLAGTSIAPSERMGYYSQYTQAQNRLAASQAQQQLNLGMGYSQLGLQGQQLGQGQQALGLQQQGQQQNYALAQQQLGQQAGVYSQAQQTFNPTFGFSNAPSFGF